MLTPLMHSLAHLLLKAVKGLTAIHNSTMHWVLWIGRRYQGYGTAGLPAVGQRVLCGGAPSIGTSMEQLPQHPWGLFVKYMKFN